MNLQVGEGVRIELEVITTIFLLIIIAIIMNHQCYHATHALTYTQVTKLWGERMIRSAVVHPGQSHTCKPKTTQQVFDSGKSAEGCAINEGRAFCVIHKQVLTVHNANVIIIQ